jgi:hypothetical protein
MFKAFWLEAIRAELPGLAYEILEAQRRLPPRK